jgi:hypothetical protein
VPGEAARLGLEFLTSKIPHASPKVIMDFLRSMNKVHYSLVHARIHVRASVFDHPCQSGCMEHKLTTMVRFSFSFFVLCVILLFEYKGI